MSLDALKHFFATNQMLEHDLDRVEQEFAVDLGRGHSHAGEADSDYYPQIEAAFRAEAAQMAPHYEMFYSLEKTIRALISDTIESTEGKGWWTSTRVPSQLQKQAEERRQRELDTGMTPRSDERIDYLTFGELSEIIKSNWNDIFGGIFSSIKAVERIMANLNALRAPIAHCSPLADDEVVRLKLTMRDWFRLME